YPFWRRQMLGVSVYEYFVVLGLYLFFAFSYHLTLWLNGMDFRKEGESLFSLKEFMDNAGLQYLCMALLTLPIWWVVFRGLKHWELKYRLLLHLPGLPLFVLAGWKGYYWLAEQLGFGHLGGWGQVWDIYIPALFYFIQFGIFHGYEYYRNNQRNLQLKAALSEAALKSELAALKAQLNPHFLYNTFNAISASVPPEQEQTREMIAQLADLFRYQLKASKTEQVALGEELGFVEKYLALEKARFEDRLQVVVDVPEALRERKVPPMILQPLVENSIRHGISNLIEGGQVLIRIRPQGERLAFEVSDTGTGVQEKAHLFRNGGVGLKNTRLRLEKQYNSHLKISDNQPRGLKIEFII
ncbi:sensor histidine kinase, partial [Phaeodactylibacter xiamenensis]|uniref:sensor histidine kinase n=1 Tax=Phaeodactylibacter xiamenensis TaxID=1524460 RepID=UPI0024A80488